MEQLVYKKPDSIKDDFKITFCPGCDHGVAVRLVAEVLDELGVRERTIGIASVGCSVFSYDFFNVDIVESAHGRSLAVATGVKRAKPDKIVFTYQGDGDAATIGFNELVHTALRGENITTICVNNTNFGMTGGQASATSILGQITATTRAGRDAKKSGFPIKISEMIAKCDGAAYVARVAIFSPQSIRKAKEAIKKAFEYQIKGLGFSFVEVIAACPTGWKLKPVEALSYIKDEILKVHKLDVFKDVKEGIV